MTATSAHCGQHSLRSFTGAQGRRAGRRDPALSRVRARSRRRLRRRSGRSAVLMGELWENVLEFVRLFGRLIVGGSSEGGRKLSRAERKAQGAVETLRARRELRAADSTRLWNQLRRLQLSVHSHLPSLISSKADVSRERSILGMPR